mgnify:CR=1 FL=1|jgi:eukaryotic-like serine/threonine-protein kinase
MKRIIRIAVVLGLVGALTLKAGCSNEKVPQKKANQMELEANFATIEKEMVLIPAGKFVMGSPASEKGRRDDETQHEVILTKPFYMGKYEVTQEQWEVVMGNNPSNTKGAKFPVTVVSWKDCQEFISKLNANTKGGYRLPYEGEWEYACRAGTTTAYSFGDKITPKNVNFGGSNFGKALPVASKDANIDGDSIKEVGSYIPNAFGLYDMHGNVWEWCEDEYKVYSEGSVTDPKGTGTGRYHVLRGGSFVSNGSLARSSIRSTDFMEQTYRLGYGGFRLVRTP